MESGIPFKKIAFIGGYAPRQCGIATFTTDLCENIAAEFPATTCLTVAVTDRAAGYDYPPRVRVEVQEHDLDSYRRAADFLNLGHVDAVCLQHEYGIFGGPAGSHILNLLSELRMPVVTTLHTVLRDPNPQQRRVLERLGQLSDRLVVMSQRGKQFLRDIYNINERRIDVIPHGVHDVPFATPPAAKERFGVAGKVVLLTFGLLSPNKGIEHVIEALPAIVARHPQVVYMLLGATHPNVRRQHGEAYREQLQRLAESRGVAKNVIFMDRFVSLPELMEFISAADIYITPYLNAAQISSGTLAYTLGAGKAIISTPYWYAEELLAEGRGVLVPFSDAGAIADSVRGLLDDDEARDAMRQRAYDYGREMTWSKVARSYVASMRAAYEERSRNPRPVFMPRAFERRLADRLPVNLHHLQRMTDDTGLLQHATFTVPNYAEGYTTDDNARGLCAAVLLERLGESPIGPACDLALRYLAFLRFAFDASSGRFHNFLSFDRRWLDQVGSEDCQGRALESLGLVIRRSQQADLCGAAAQLFEAALPAVASFSSPRAWAFTLLGLSHYLQRFSGDRAALALRDDLALRLHARLLESQAPEWPWFEDRLTYSNAVLPHALLLSAQAMGRPELASAALTALRWLFSVQESPEGHFMPIGSNGFFVRGQAQARFDQQPVEAQVMISACLAARALTGDELWNRLGQRAFDWFLGKNDLQHPLYDPQSGGCRDGLHPDGCNQNQGAESTLAFLLAQLELRLADAAALTPRSTEMHPNPARILVPSLSKSEVPGALQ